MTRSRRGWATPLSLSLAAVALLAGCSKASNGQGQGATDAGSDTTVCEDCAQGDAEVDAGLVDTGWVCPFVPGSSAGAACDTCIQSSCDAVWCTCAEDRYGNEAGVPGCFAYLTCLQSCPADGGVSGDASVPGDAGACAECAPGTYSATQEQEGQAVLSCIAQSCATECPAGFTLTL
jgi:hypothetical protein